jgi:hypothetical protein
MRGNGQALNDAAKYFHQSIYRRKFAMRGSDRNLKTSDEHTVLLMMNNVKSALCNLQRTTACIEECVSAKRPRSRTPLAPQENVRRWPQANGAGRRNVTCRLLSGDSAEGMAPTHQVGNAEETERYCCCSCSCSCRCAPKTPVERNSPKMPGLPSCVFLHAGRASPTRWPCGGLQ